MDGEGGVRFDVVGVGEGSGVVGAVVLDARVSGGAGGVACWVRGDVIGAFGLQLASSASIKNTVTKTACFMIASGFVVLYTRKPVNHYYALISH